MLRAVFAAIAAAVTLHAPAVHSPYTPNPKAAIYWTHRYFHGAAAQLMLCVAHTESRYELAATNGVNVGPWQVNLLAHSWVNGRRIRSSWHYAAAVAWHLSGYGTDYSAWRPDCGI